MITTRPSRAALLAAAIAACLSGCGSDGSAGAEKDFTGQSVKQIVADVKRAMEDLRSVHIWDAFSGNGSVATVDLAVDVDGDCTGSATFGADEVQVLGVDGELFLKADQAFWDKQAAGGGHPARLGDHWVTGAFDDPRFDKLCDLDTIIDDTFNPDDDGRTTTKGDVTGTGGRRAMELRSVVGDQTVSAWVATTGRHYLLYMIVDSANQAARVKFSEFDEKVVVTRPDADDVIDLRGPLA